MYFNHAYRKSFLGTDANRTPGILDQAVTGSTSALDAGEIGLFDAQTYTAFANENGGKPFILAQGSYFTTDIIGGNRFLGGYQESVKSKVINPKYITRVFTTCAVEPQNQIMDVCVCNLECGKTYRLRLDLKGSPALRFLSHNIYRTLDFFTGCCTDDCSATCTGACTDPTLAVIGWAKQIAENPILSQFIQVEVIDYEGNAVADNLTGGSTPGLVEFEAALDAYSPNTPFDPDSNCEDQACIKIHVAYVETKFGYCTFTPTDFYELMPLQIFPSLTDETGDACNVQCVDITESQAPVQAQGVGETVIRDLILTGRYRQEAYPDSSRVESLRMREIEANPVLAAVDRNGLYNSVNILHSVPRYYNPTGTFDNDQYLLTIYAKVGINMSAFLAQLQSILDFCCPGLEIEHYNGECDDVVPTTTTTVAPTTTTTTTSGIG